MKEKFKEALRKYPLQTIGAIPFIPIVLVFFLWGLIVNPIPTLILFGIGVAVFSIFCILYLIIETDIFD